MRTDTVRDFKCALSEMEDEVGSQKLLMSSNDTLRDVVTTGLSIKKKSPKSI